MNSFNIWIKSRSQGLLLHKAWEELFPGLNKESRKCVWPQSSHSVSDSKSNLEAGASQVVWDKVILKVKLCPHGEWQRQTGLKAEDSL